MSEHASEDVVSIEVGTELPAQRLTITRADLVRYAGASLDFNPIHWNERFAEQVGLPGVIAHGMLTMALAGRVVTDWLATNGGSLLDYSVRFTRPVLVPDTEDGATVELSAKVSAVREDGSARVDITAKFEGRAVLGKAIAIVRPE